MNQYTKFIFYIDHTEKECDINEEIHVDAMRIKKVKKRKTNDEKGTISVKRKKVDNLSVSKGKKGEPTIKVKKASKRLESNLIKEKVTSKLEVKKPQHLKIYKKIKLRNKLNGVVNTKKKTKK